jgi:exonuclease III
LASWNADGARNRKQELDHFVGQHSIDICLLAETHLRSREVFRLANYVCHRNDQLTERGRTAILGRRGILHAVPVQGLQHLEAAAIHVMVATKPVKILAAYMSPTRPLIASDLSECLGGDLPHVGLPE